MKREQRSALRLFWRLTLGACVSVGACTSTPDDTRDDLPEAFRNAAPVNVGALLCNSGALSDKTSSAERAALLAEDVINGSTRAFSVPADQIPCRQQDNCGVWAGRDAAGQDVRAPLKIVFADTEGKVTRATATAESLVTDFGAQVLIGPCSAAELYAVQSQVTKAEVALLTPFVTADGVAQIDDRTPTDKVNNWPGYVNSLITPDYIQAQVISHVATNSRNEMVRFEDWSDDECSTQSAAAADNYCIAGHGANSRCLLRTQFAVSEKDYYEVTTTSCDEDSDCKSVGANTACVAPEKSDKKVCQRFRIRKFCANTTQPVAAAILYEQSAFGVGLQAEVANFWVNRKAKKLLTSVGFDASSPSAFPDVIAQFFAVTQAALDDAKATGALPADSQLADVPIFLLTQTTPAALLLQEWNLQAVTLQLPDGADRVFWIGVDTLRSSLVTSQMDLHVLRNVYALDPYAIPDDNQDFFSTLYGHRWNAQPGQYAGSVFDSVLLTALANERGGRCRKAGGANCLDAQEPAGELGPNSAQVIKNSLQAVSAGCTIRTVGTPCATPPTGFQAAEYASALATLHNGAEIKFYGVTGDASLTPAGDRVNPTLLWKMAPAGDHPGFFSTLLFNPPDIGAEIRR